MLHLSSLHVLTHAGEIRPLAQVIARQPGQGGDVALRYQDLISGTTPAAVALRAEIAEAIYLLDNTLRHHLTFPAPEAEARRLAALAAAQAQEAAAQAAAKARRIEDLKAQIARIEGTAAVDAVPAVKAPPAKKKA